MTSKQIILLLIICFYSCNDNSKKMLVDSTVDTIKTENTKKVEPDLSDITTSQGNVIKYKRSGDDFQIQWFQNGQLRTFEEQNFQVYGADSWIPRFKKENENYVLLEAGCGNPCWLGLFLPLNGEASPKLIHEYLAYDLNQNYVAYINFDLDSLEILNLKSDQTQRFKIGNCESAFKGWCFDTMYFDKKTLQYSWDSLVRWETKVKRINKLIIKI